MNNWNAIVKFYADRHADIMAERSDEWALDPYEWDNCGLLRMTPIEEMLWGDMRDLSMVMYPQYPVGRVFVDFGNPKAKVAIECDGHAYHLDKAKDRDRDAILADMGWVVYRFTGRQCVEDFDEEEMTDSFAKQALREVCRRHAVSRRARAPSKFISGVDAFNQLFNRSEWRELFRTHT